MLPANIRSKIKFQPCPRFTACWMWTGYVNPGGFPIASDKGESPPAHRYVYQKYRGPIRDGKQLRRLCPNKTCVNPNHYEVRQ